VDISSAYVAAGWRIVETPKLYFHPDDPGDHGLCSMRRLENSLTYAKYDEPNIWRWEIASFKGGVVDAVWDVPGFP
jgi:hypothetical protein